MADKVGETFNGWVTGVQAYGLFVELQEVYVQGLVHVSSMTDDYYALDEKAHRLTGQDSGRSFRLGDRIEVRVAKVDLGRRQVDLVLEDVAARAEAGGARGEPQRAARGGRGSRSRSDRPGAPREGEARSHRSTGRGRTKSKPTSRKRR
jgi:ribonuclease R